MIEFVLKNPTISLNDLNKIIACEGLIKFEAAQSLAVSELILEVLFIKRCEFKWLLQPET